MLNLIGQFDAKLEIQTEIVDTPAFVDAHIDAICGIGNQVVQRPRPWLEVHVGHTNHRKAIPAIGAYTAIAGQSEYGSCVTGHQVASEDTVGDDGRSLRRNAFIIPSKGAQSAREGGVSGNVQACLWSGSSYLQNRPPCPAHGPVQWDVRMIRGLEEPPAGHQV